MMEDFKEKQKLCLGLISEIDVLRAKLDKSPTSAEILFIESDICKIYAALGKVMYEMAKMEKLV